MNSRLKGRRHPQAGVLLKGIGQLRRLCFMMLLTAFILVSCGGDQSAHVHDTYTCPMHPTVISDRPGTCPVCAMDLVRKAREGEEVEITQDLAVLLKSPSENVVASVKTIRGEYAKHPTSIKVRGVISYDTRTIYRVSARIGGRLEKVSVKYPFQKIRKGQKIAEVYSPDLVTAQRELLFLIENDPSNEYLIRGAKERLMLLGATANQVERVIRRKAAEYSFPIFSPVDGYVIAEEQQSPSGSLPSRSAPSAMAAGGMTGMADGTGIGTSSPANATPSSQGISIREGDYVSAGQALFGILNPSMLRVELDVPMSDKRGIRMGAPVSIALANADTLSAKVDFIQPFFSEGDEFLKVWVYITNSGNLTVGQLVDAEITLPSVEGLWIPREAIVDLGARKIVFVKEKGTFVPKTITTGGERDGFVQINGLASSEEVAANGQYLVDSESFIRIE